MEDKKRFLIGLGVVLILLAGFFWLRGRREEQVDLGGLTEEVFVNQKGMVEKNGGEERLMTEEEETQLKATIDRVIDEGKAEKAELRAVSGHQGSGTAWRVVSEGRYYHKIEVAGLAGLEKGYFYEGWLVKDADELVSSGRLAMEDTQGHLYYVSSTDKSNYFKVVVTREPEDGNPEPAEHVLEGEFVL